MHAVRGKDYASRPRAQSLGVHLKIVADTDELQQTSIGIREAFSA
jgi:hypothetical protein